MTLCLSTMSLHLGHWQSLQLQKRLCPFRGDTKPWFLQREHLGILGGFRPLEGHTLLLGSGTCLLGFSLLMANGCTRIRRTQSELARPIKDCSSARLGGYKVTVLPRPAVGMRDAGSGGENWQRRGISLQQPACSTPQLSARNNDSKFCVTPGTSHRTSVEKNVFIYLLVQKHWC